MGKFRDTEHLYRILDAFFGRLLADDAVARELHAAGFVLRFRYTEPPGQVTIDLRALPIRWEFGDTDLRPDLEMIQSADTAHEFWLGRLNVPGAIATRKVVARGPIAKALKLLPAIKPAFPIYAATLAELGERELLPPAGPAAAPGGRWQTMFADLVERVFTLVPDLRQLAPALHRPGRRPAAAIDRARLGAHLVPLVDQVTAPAPAYREQPLPAEPAALRAEMLARMLLIRAFEERLARAYAAGEVPTEAIHLSIGQEATAVGACFALRADDYIATTHRGHGHMLAKGADLHGMMAEILGKATGLCGGKGGSMHVTEAAVGAIGANGIVGASPLLAAGAAHAARLRGSDQVAVAFFGDGATNQGMFHEAANFAAVFDLPVVFVIENNQYGEFTALDRHTRVPVLSERAAAYGMPGVTVDGNDCWAVYQATREAVARARAGHGPTLLECVTYRWHGHMEGEAAAYRSAEELAAWKARCPIAALRVELGDAVDAAALEAAARDRVDAAFARAQDAPPPGPEAMTTDVFSPEPAHLYRGPEVDAGRREITFSAALWEALAEELARDPAVYLLGEDVATGGYFAVTAGLIDRFGAERIIDTPISEYAIVGTAVGAAMSGRRPVAEILFSDFLTTCMDPIVNNAAKLRYMSGGQYRVPLVVRTPGGAGLGMAAQHSQSLEALLTGIPGLIVVAPATPCDAKGLLKAAIRSNNPVLFFENKLLYASTGPVPESDYLVPLGVASVVRRGRDVTLVSVGGVLGRVAEAAAELAAGGVDAEIVDVRTLVPLDLVTIVDSVVKTGRLVTVEDGSLTHGFGAEIVARVVEAAWPALTAPPVRVAALDVPIPYASNLENAVIPDAARIVAAARRLTRRSA